MSLIKLSALRSEQTTMWRSLQPWPKLVSRLFCDVQNLLYNQEMKGFKWVDSGWIANFTRCFVAKKHGEEPELTHREFELPSTIWLVSVIANDTRTPTWDSLGLWLFWWYALLMWRFAVYVKRLRIRCRPEYILTRRGVGYYMRNKWLKILDNLVSSVDFLFLFQLF